MHTYAVCTYDAGATVKGQRTMPLPYANRHIRFYAVLQYNTVVLLLFHVSWVCSAHAWSMYIHPCSPHLWKKYFSTTGSTSTSTFHSPHVYGMDVLYGEPYAPMSGPNPYYLYQVQLWQYIILGASCESVEIKIAKVISQKPRIDGRLCSVSQSRSERVFAPWCLFVLIRMIIVVSALTGLENAINAQCSIRNLRGHPWKQWSDSVEIYGKRTNREVHLVTWPIN